MIRRIAILALLGVFSLPTSARAHSLTVPELMFRLDSHRPYEIQPGVRTGLESAVWTNDGTAFLQLLEVPDFRRPDPHPAGIYSRSIGTPNILLFERGLTPTNLTWSQQNQSLYFELTNSGLESLGIFKSVAGKEKEQLIWHNEDRAAVSGLQALQNGALLAREKMHSGLQRLSVYNSKTDESDIFLEEGSHIPGTDEEVAFIFSPTASEGGKFFGTKVRSESGADYILLWQNIDGSKENEIAWRLVRSFPVSHHSSESLFDRADNSFCINDHGDIVLGATWLSGTENNKRRSLFLVPHSEEVVNTQEITPISKLGEQKVLMHFYSGFNNKRQVVFRVKAGTSNSSGEELWLAENGLLRMLVEQKTLLKTDLGDASLDQSLQNKLSFFQSPQINDRGEVLFGALLKSKRTARNIGLGFFRLRTLH